MLSLHSPQKNGQPSLHLSCQSQDFFLIKLIFNWLSLKFFVLYQVKSYHIRVEQIERELNDIETNLAQLEKEGVELEKKLRSCEEGTFTFPVTLRPQLNTFSHFLRFPCLEIEIKSNVDKSGTSFSV